MLVLHDCAKMLKGFAIVIDNVRIRSGEEKPKDPIKIFRAFRPRQPPKPWRADRLRHCREGRASPSHLAQGSLLDLPIVLVRVELPTQPAAHGGAKEYDREKRLYARLEHWPRNGHPRWSHGSSW